MMVATKNVVIDDAAFCFWGAALDQENLAFLRAIDTKYFHYQADLHLEKLQELEQAAGGAPSEHLQHAALALRTLYSQSLEAMFAYLGALVQSPHFPLGWLLYYKDHQVRSVVRKISEGRPVYHRLSEGPPSWSGISAMLGQHVDWPDQEERKYCTEGFGRLLPLLADDLLDEQRRLEYNSLKHGIRQAAGGFTLYFKDNDSGPDGKVHRLGGSKFGSHFYVGRPIKGAKHHVVLGHSSVNWDPEVVAARIHLIACVIHNAITFMRGYNGEDAAALRTRLPGEHDVFEKAQRVGASVGHLAFEMDIELPEATSLPSEKDILSTYPRGPGSPDAVP